jgi:hypothetical protein
LLEAADRVLTILREDPSAGRRIAVPATS